MTVKELYQKLGITPNLAEHMYRVTGVVEFLQSHWIGQPLDWDRAKRTSLLHDVGNIVKFDLESHPEFLGDEENRIDYWKGKQQETIDKYGIDDHDATKKMLKEANVNSDIIDTILNKSFGNSVATATNEDWYAKILFYSDLRVLPNRVGTLDERINDVKTRMPKYTNRSDFSQLVDACYQLEKQIHENLNVAVSEISDATIKVDAGKYQQINI